MPLCRQTITGFSQEITMIDDGITSDPEKFVTEIRIPVDEKKIIINSCHSVFN